MNWPWQTTNESYPVVIWDGEQGRLWARAESGEELAAKHWFWQDTAQPLPADLLHADMRAVACLLPCGVVRWHGVTIPAASEAEQEKMLSWEVADLITADDHGTWIAQPLPPNTAVTNEIEILVGIVRADVLAQAQAVIPQGAKERRLVPEEIAIGQALPDADARVLRVSGDDLTALLYRRRRLAEVRHIQDAQVLSGGAPHEDLPWYVVADTKESREYWQRYLQAAPWPALTHADYLTAGGTLCEIYPQIILGASRAAGGSFYWKQSLAPTSLALQERLPALPWHTLAVGAAVIGLAAASMGGYMYWDASAEWEQNQAVYASHEPERNELAALTAAGQLLADRQRERLVWSKILLVVADSRPEGVYLTKIGEEDDRIVLTGVCLEPSALQSWKEYLQLRLQRRATVKYMHTQEQSRREFRMVLYEDEAY